MSSTSSSLHCATQLVASQFERTIRIAGDPPGGPAGPAGPAGPTSPAVPGGPAGPGSPLSQPTRPTDNVIAIRARYRCMAFPQRMASLGVLGNNYAEFPRARPPITSLAGLVRRGRDQSAPRAPA